MRMNQPMIVGLVAGVILVVAAVLLFIRLGQSWGFEDFVKNPELWEKMNRGRNEADRVIEESRRWSDVQIADEVEHFLFGIKSGRDSWAKGRALEQLAVRVHAHVLRFLQDTSLRA